jgi:putative MFS transporter
MSTLASFGKVAGVSARLNRIPVVTRSQKRWGAIAAFLLLFEMMDLNTFAYTAPVLKSQWHLSIGDVANVTGFGFLGMFIGSCIGGRVSDLIGRKRSMLVFTVFYSVCSLCSAVANNIVELGILRGLTGVGLQATMVVLITYVSEMFPTKFRGRAQAYISAVSLLGVPAVAWFSRLVVPLGTEAWRWVYVLGGAGLIMALVSLKALPESARWLEIKGRSAEAEKTLARIEAEARLKINAELPDPVAEPNAATGKFSDLAKNGNLRRVVVLSLLMSFGLAGFYGYNSWLPTLLVSNGLSGEESLIYTSVLSLAAVPGALVAIFFVDKMNRKNALMTIMLTLGVLMPIFGLVGGAAAILTFGLVITLLLQTWAAVLYSYIPEIFPTALRGLGAGIGNGVGRLGAFASTLVLAAIFATFGYTSVFVYLSIVLILGGLVVGVLGVKTHNRTLEAASADANAAAPAAVVAPVAARGR